MQPLEINPQFHLDAIHEFLNFFGLQKRRPSLIYLQQILKQFAKLPYENLSKIISLHESSDWHAPIIRLPEKIISDHIAFRLGGTCFSLTFFLQSILRQLGFMCYPVMADMRAGKNIHCGLVAIIGGTRYLVDPGYLLTEPMEINPRRPKIYRTEHAGIELQFNVKLNAFELFTFDQNEKKWRYRFSDRIVPQQEFLGHWLASFNRNSMHGLCLTKVLKGGVLFVNRTFMRETTFGSKKNFNIKKNYHEAIHDHFGIGKDIVEQAQAALDENLERKHDLGLWIPKRRLEVA